MRNVVSGVVTCSRSDLRRHIQPIRRWCRKADGCLKDAVGTVGESASLSGSLAWASEQPSRRFVVAVGFSHDDFVSVRQTTLGPGTQVETLLHLPDGDAHGTNPSASLLSTGSPSVCVDEDVSLYLRKSVLRLRALQAVHASAVKTDQQLRDYFTLRHDVWQSLGYLSREAQVSSDRFELDYSDRTAEPIFFRSRQGDQPVIACGRLVRGFGQEQPLYVEMIMRLIAQENSKLLHDRFTTPPTGIPHPFDVLEAFPEFSSYYQQLVRGKIRKAEMSRVIVHPDHQGTGLGEVMVDTLVYAARQRGIEKLFLACKSAHRSFYERCGFLPIRGMNAESFLGIAAESIAMEINLREVLRGRSQIFWLEGARHA